MAVPIRLQLELLGKMAAYDRNFKARSGGRVRVLILGKAENTESTRIAEQLSAGLRDLPLIGGLGHDQWRLDYRESKALCTYCKSHSIGIVYLTPGLNSALPEIVNALTGLDLLSVCAEAAAVPAGVVLGFDLVSGKPKMLVHLTQARLQNVEFRSDVLKLARVYR